MLLSKFAKPALRLAALVLVAFGAACTTSMVQPLDQDKSVSAHNPQALCGRVAEIKSMPFKDERVDDAAYNALVDAGEAVVPCLIDKVADATPMRDPRGIPGPTDTRVGDVAFFVLIDVAKLDFESMMPPEVKSVFKEEGVYAYHRFLREEANRKRFQSSLREWYRRKNGVLPQPKNAL
ncbi:MAG TPA: hypothetical protein VJU84_21480 [Pyrinomonadaceae bacterium]|nr:hypothetical protein [Pyrinomonadaceae bacterium]